MYVFYIHLCVNSLKYFCNPSYLRAINIHTVTQTILIHEMQGVKAGPFGPIQQTSYCSSNCFRGLVGSVPQQVRVVLVVKGRPTQYQADGHCVMADCCTLGILLNLTFDTALSSHKEIICEQFLKYVKANRCNLEKLRLHCLLVVKS